MARKSKLSPFAVVATIPALILLGLMGRTVVDKEETASAQAESGVETSQETTPVLVEEPTAGETPEEALARIIASKKIINVHEHIQDMRQVPIMLQAMDQWGMHKTLLMGSSWFTITLNEKVGFTRYDENNEKLLEIQNAHPDRFVAYPTIDPQDPEKLEKLKSLVARGAKGVKLYLGHGYTRRDTGEYMFHTMAMDDPEMFPVYEFCEENYVPLCFHMQPFKPGFAQEFIAVVTNFPDLKINAPHFMLSSIKQSRLREFLDAFPNVYSDISFGHDDFLTAGLKRISKDTEKFRELFQDYPDRFLFGTDLVMTEAASKTVPWFGERAKAYYDMLTKKQYTTPILPDMTLNGLELTSPLLDNILYRNYERFEEMKPKGTQIKDDIEWGPDTMGVPKLDRKPGQAFPPPQSKGRD